MAFAGELSTWTFVCNPYICIISPVPIFSPIRYFLDILYQTCRPAQSYLSLTHPLSNPNPLKIPPPPQKMPPTQPTWASSLYNARAPTYDDSWHPTFASHLIAIADPQPGHRVLDLAAGTGLASYAAAARVAPTGHVVGVDVATAMLAKAREKRDAFLAEMSVRFPTVDLSGLLQFHQADVAHLASLQSLHGREGSFDVATCASALVLLADPLAAISAWVNYLKPGGKLVLDVPHEHNQRPLALMERAAKKIGVPLAFNRAWVSGEGAFRSVLEGAGCVVENVQVVAQTGTGVRMLEGGAEGYFEGALGAFEVGERRAELRRAFGEEWESACEEGAVRDVDGVYLAVARKV